MNQQVIREKIIKICGLLNSKGMLAAADGNVSYKISDTEILITPSGKNKAWIEPNDIAVITLDNQIVSGNPSSERLMHLAVYQKCKAAKAIVHAHPPTAIAWSVAQPKLKELPSKALSEIILAVGSIPFVPYARPGTIDMGNVLAPYLPGHRAMILSRHGALSWGEDLNEAYNGMERIEHSAIILRDAHVLGGVTELPPEEVDVLRDMRKKLGDKIL